LDIIEFIGFFTTFCTVPLSFFSLFLSLFLQNLSKG